ncbi:LlaJI family restriction endonuclease [Ectobacillus antri]|uniref:LlaJI family restriction endonuclease n=1 Tax=Ectobacillus antri TaxID=2486280 RepID=UPI000F592803|nr:LlaJI family restriction endonuclease [Ectobacillus antri]
MNNLHFFVDYEWKQNDSIEIPLVFYERGLCEKARSGLIRFKVTGIIEYYDDLFIVLPKGTDLSIYHSESEKKKVARLLYKVLSKYSKVNSLDQDERYWLGDNESTEVFEIVQWLFEDYRQNGLIHTQRRSEQINGKGRIDWSKTLSKQTPVFIKKKLFYLDLITSKNDLVSDPDVTLIHAFVLKEATKRFGWLYNFDFEFSFDSIPYNLKQMQYKLQKALSNTYVDREMVLLKKLLSYLKQVSNEKKSDNLSFLVTPFFNNIWEKICANFVGDVPALHAMIPNPYWVFEKQLYRTAQIPDILFQIDHSIIIFDAKYYRIKAGLDKLPGWGDIVKQLFYALSMKKGFNEVFNVFLFPDTRANVFEFLGYASVENREDEFGEVLAFGIDIETAMKFYVNELSVEKRIEFLKKLIKELQSRKQI